MFHDVTGHRQPPICRERRFTRMAVQAASRSSIIRLSLAVAIASAGLASMLGMVEAARASLVIDAGYSPNAGETCFATPDGGATVFSSTDASAVQDAVTAANPGDTIRAAGYCAGVHEVVHEMQTVHIPKELTLRGGYTTTNWSTAFPVTQPTTLDAQGLGRVIYATDRLTMADMTVQNGSISGAGGCPSGCGGGVFAAGALSLDGVDIRGNTAASDGGGVYAFGVTRLSDDLFLGNSCTSVDCRGGGLFVYGVLMLNGSRFIGNVAAGSGGGAYVTSGLVSHSEIANALFARNAAGMAAAIYLIEPTSGNGTADVINTTIASPTLSSGPAIGIGAGAVNITNTSIASYTIGISNAVGTVCEDYNLFYSNVITSAGLITHGAHSFVDNPGFVDPRADDYHLASPSAAIDRGVDAGVYADLDGHPRPQGAGYDIGAYESSFFVDLSIVKSVTPAAAAAGHAITYTLAFSNAGNRTATGVVITDTGSAGWVSNMAYVASIPVTPAPGLAFSWQVGSLAPDATARITLTGIFSPADEGEASYINVAHIGSADAEIITANNRSSAELTQLQAIVYLPVVMH
jgi:uncharacterized repeat protein (TIGR01451 family)